jgi:hypothetical protein
MVGWWERVRPLAKHGTLAHAMALEAIEDTVEDAQD